MSKFILKLLEIVVSSMIWMSIIFLVVYGLILSAEYTYKSYGLASCVGVFAAYIIIVPLAVRELLDSFWEIFQ